MARYLTLLLALSAAVAIPPWVPVAAAALWALWLLPDWVDKWLAVRERWDRIR